MNEALLQKVIAARKAIRLHRDQVGDDRCWLDDYLLYEILPEREEISMPPKAEFMDKCRQFFQCRQRPQDNPTAKPYDDHDLKQMNDQALSVEFDRLYKAISCHRKRGEARTWDDDLALYLALPEKCPGNTTLPKESEFLDSCDKFYSTRGNPPKLHQW